MGVSIKQKICLIGPGAVGKTSLIRRFVFDQFSDRYLTTIGTKVTKKEIEMKHPITEEDISVKMLIWDIMGQRAYSYLIKEYFQGARGAIAVCDVTRKNTLYELEGWIQSMFDVTENVPIVFIGNKCDLEDKMELTFEDVKKFASSYGDTTVLLSSAKTGLNVRPAFTDLAEKIVRRTNEQNEQPVEKSG